MPRIHTSLIESDFGSHGTGNFEAVLLSGSDLWHFWHDNSDVNLPWSRGQRVTGGGDDVAGPGCIIQSDFKSGDHGNFEVVVPLRRPDGRLELWHFWHDNSDVNLPWSRGQRVTGGGDDVAGPGCIIQSDFKSGDHGNFEVVVPLRRPDGRLELVALLARQQRCQSPMGPWAARDGRRR